MKRTVLLGASLVLGLLLISLVGRLRRELKAGDAPPTFWALTSSEDTVTLTPVGTPKPNRARFRLTNKSGRTISWADSYPCYRLRQRDRLCWRELHYLVCGNGLGPCTLPNGQSADFDVVLPENGSRAVQVGVNYYGEPNGNERFTVWSAPFTAPPPADDREESKELLRP